MRNTHKIGQCLTLYEKGTHLGAIITPKEILDKPCLLYQNVLKNCLWKKKKERENLNSLNLQSGMWLLPRISYADNWQKKLVLYFIWINETLHKDEPGSTSISSSVSFSPACCFLSSLFTLLPEFSSSSLESLSLLMVSLLQIKN